MTAVDELVALYARGDLAAVAEDFVATGAATSAGLPGTSVRTMWTERLTWVDVCRVCLAPFGKRLTRSGDSHPQDMGRLKTL
jgi:hypothetical protein